MCPNNLQLKILQGNIRDKFRIRRLNRFRKVESCPFETAGHTVGKYRRFYNFFRNIQDRFLYQLKYNRIALFHDFLLIYKYELSRLVGAGQNSPAVSDLECCDSIRIHRGKTLIRRDGGPSISGATLESNFSSRTQSTRTYPSPPDVSFRRLQKLSERQKLELWFFTWGLSSVPASTPILFSDFYCAMLVYGLPFSALSLTQIDTRMLNFIILNTSVWRDYSAKTRLLHICGFKLVSDLLVLMPMYNLVQKLYSPNLS